MASASLWLLIEVYLINLFLLITLVFKIYFGKLIKYK